MYARNPGAPLMEIVFFQVSHKVWSWDHFCSFSTWTIYHLYLIPPQPVGFLLTTVWSIDLSNLFQTMWPCRKILNHHIWGETRGLKFNVSKCNIMHLSRKSVLPTRFYTLGGRVITSVSESKYLGVTFSNNYGTRSSQWKSYISQSASKANQRLAFLCRNQGGPLTSFASLRIFPWSAPLWSTVGQYGTQLSRRSVIGPVALRALFQ